jgi:protein-disulfide isomerase
MSFDRRRLLAATAGAALLAPGLARAQGEDPRLAPRTSGRPDARAEVIEYFSLTCPHCAEFHKDTWPRIKQELVDSGQIRMVWRDFPLDQLALAAAAIARALPVASYEGYVSALLATQDRWAFARNVDNKEEIFRVAALAGMSRSAFDAAWGDEALRRAVLETRLRGEREHNVNATPTFVFGGNRSVSGAISYDRFAAEAAR